MPRSRWWPEEVKRPFAEVLEGAKACITDDYRYRLLPE